MDVTMDMFLQGVCGKKFALPATTPLHRESYQRSVLRTASFRAGKFTKRSLAAARTFVGGRLLIRARSGKIATIN